MTISLDRWREADADDDGPAYARIVSRLEHDIQSGALGAGARLPTQRALAQQLGLGLGTVTRAYAEAEARGLIEAVVGRGSFVAQPRAPVSASGPIDLSRNLAPLDRIAGPVRQAFAAAARRADLIERIDYAPPGGFEADRRAAQLWLRQASNFPGADARRLIITAGAQQAMAVALAALCRPGETLAMEAATFHGARLAAAQAGLRVAPVSMDGEGMTPEALGRTAVQTGARVAYLQPFQNPTARVMSEARRRELLEIARRHGMILIEDDLYGPYVADLGLPTLAELAPDRVAYVSGLSKCLAPGLRTGFLSMPEAYRAKALESLRALAFGPPTLGPLIATELIETGAALELWSGIRADVRQRLDVASAVLAGHFEPLRQRASPHIWAPLSELEAERVAGQALRAGVIVTSPQAPFPAGAPVSGLRLCLGAAPDLATLERGLRVVKDALEADDSLGEAVV